MEHLERTHTIFGEVMEGDDTLEKLNALYCDAEHRPFQDVRVLHTYVLDDPFDDPPPLAELVPPDSPAGDRPAEERVKARLKYDDGSEDTKVGRPPLPQIVLRSFVRLFVRVSIPIAVIIHTFTNNDTAPTTAGRAHGGGDRGQHPAQGGQVARHRAGDDRCVRV